MAKSRSAVSSILDKDTKSLPNIIGAFRNGRTDQVGYDDPTYFGFAIDIHSTEEEAKGTYNPWTGLRGSPLFYLPTWATAGLNKDSGIMAKNDTGKNFPELLADASEACAIQYLNSFGLDLAETPDEFEPNRVILNSAAATLANGKRPGGKLNRGFYLMEFIKILNLIQDKTPWIFKEVDGISELWKASHEATDLKPVSLGITCDETVDLRITRLAEAYRMLSYDAFNHRKVLPPNLEKFSMDVYFIDLRFLRNAKNTSDGSNPLIGGGGAIDYDNEFSAQVNFGGIAFRCFGCKFDFSNLLESSTAVKSSLSDSSGFQPKFKINIDKVMPASYFGDLAFGTKGLTEDINFMDGGMGNALGGALDLGPFTGGITRVLSAGRRALTNILGKPQRALNDALLGIERKFDAYIDKTLDESGLSSRPFDRWTPTTLESVVAERGGSVASEDLYPGTVFQQIQQRKAGGKISRDMFPGTDNRTTLPIKNDIFPGKDTRTKAPIKNDIFPGPSTQPTGNIDNDVFPGDVPISYVLNQRKSGGKITSQNPFKKP
jgi:hypothetical protein